MENLQKIEEMSKEELKKKICNEYCYLQQFRNPPPQILTNKFKLDLWNSFYESSLLLFQRYIKIMQKEYKDFKIPDEYFDLIRESAGLQEKWEQSVLNCIKEEKEKILNYIREEKEKNGN